MVSYLKCRIILFHSNNNNSIEKFVEHVENSRRHCGQQKEVKDTQMNLELVIDLDFEFSMNHVMITW